MFGCAGRLGRAEPKFDGAGGDQAVALRIDDGEFAWRERERDGLGSFGSEVDALKAGQGADGGAIDAGMGNIEFDDLIAGGGGSVGDMGGDGDGGCAGKAERARRRGGFVVV